MSSSSCFGSFLFLGFLFHYYIVDTSYLFFFIFSFLFMFFFFCFFFFFFIFFIVFFVVGVFYIGWFISLFNRVFFLFFGFFFFFLLFIFFFFFFFFFSFLFLFCRYVFLLFLFFSLFFLFCIFFFVFFFFLFSCEKRSRPSRPGEGHGRRRQIWTRDLTDPSTESPAGTDYVEPDEYAKAVRSATIRNAKLWKVLFDEEDRMGTPHDGDMRQAQNAIGARRGALLSILIALVRLRRGRDRSAVLGGATRFARGEVPENLNWSEVGGRNGPLARRLATCFRSWIFETRCGRCSSRRMLDEAVTDMISSRPSDEQADHRQAAALHERSDGTGGFKQTLAARRAEGRGRVRSEQADQHRPWGRDAIEHSSAVGPPIRTRFHDVAQ